MVNVLEHHPEYKLIIKQYQKQSRKVQRKNIKLMENKNFMQLDKLRFEQDKDKFWRQINKFKKKCNNSNEVEISNEDLYMHFNNIFGSVRENNSLITEDINESMINLDNIEYESIDISEFDFYYALEDTKYSKVSGPDGVSSILIKKCSNNFKLDIIFKLFFDIFKYGSIPTQLNHCFIKPILKDYKNSNKILSNLFRFRIRFLRSLNVFF
jgi:hypothetical protein